MNRRAKSVRHLLAVLVFALSTVTAWSQDDSSTSQAPDSGAPPAATGPAEPTLENPPVTGLDRPLTEALYGGRSYLVPGLQASEAVDSNASGKGQGATALTQGLGSLDLRRLWKRYAVGLDYVGGGVVFDGEPANGRRRAYQVHTLASDQRILWRTGQVAIRDTFDYLPEGQFGFGSYGGPGSFGQALGGSVGGGTGVGSGVTGSPNGAFNGTGIGSIGFQPRIDNSAIVDITQQISARSTVTLAGGFGLSHYLNKPNAQFPIVDSEETTAQAGYNRLLTRKDQVGILYGFQELHFPRAGSGSVNVNIWNLMYAHRITGRLNFVLGGGPQLIEVHNPAFTFLLLGVIPVRVPASTKQALTADAIAKVDYTLSSRTSLSLQYQRFVSTGSGFYAGATTNAVRATAFHLIRQRWTATADAGYSRNSALYNATGNAGINTRHYQFWYAGATVSRPLSPHFGAFASYQFNTFGSTSCSTSNGSHAFCGSTFYRNTGQVGISWHPKPIRLD